MYPVISSYGILTPTPPMTLTEKILLAMPPHIFQRHCDKVDEKQCQEAKELYERSKQHVCSLQKSLSARNVQN